MKAKSIHSLIYRNYLTSSLVPIFTIEVVLLLLYFGINYYISEENQQTLLKEATANIQEIASREVTGINNQLNEVNRMALIMQRDHESFFATGDQCHLPNGEPVFTVHDNQAFYKSQDNGGGTLYYSSTTRIDDEQRRKARCSEMLDPLLVSIVETSPIITQAYLNTWDDMNRLYPYMPDAPAQYGSAINMEDYNFYYEADAEHNPERKPIWTGAYLDPAGQGWMISLIVPVYRWDFLEGVSGLDVTIDSFVQNILSLRFPWDAGTFMVDKQGTILAMQNRVEEILHIQELGAHAYDENIMQTVEKPEEFNLLTYPDESLQRQVKQIFDSRARIDHIVIDGVDYLISQEIVPETGWRMMTLIETERVFAPITRLKNLSTNIGYIAIAVMVLFYIIFFLYLLKKSGKLTSVIATPIEELSDLTQGLGENLKSRHLQPVGIIEIDTLGQNFNTMVAELEVRTRALVEAKEAADNANTAKSRFLATMSHELKTPLNAIMGMTQLLETPDLDETEKAEFLGIILDSGNKLLMILNDILDFSNLDTNSLELHLQDFSPQEVIRSFVGKLSSKAVEKSLTVSVDLDPDIPQLVMGDEKHLERVLTNLGDNAIKFTDKGGAITVSAEAQETSDDSCLLHFTIADTGVGITQEQSQRLFQAFSQADDSSTRRYGGTGLGLIIVKRLVEMMGGSIWVDSTPGEGSTFHFTIRVGVSEPVSFE